MKRIQFESVKGLVENITGKTVQLATKGGSQSAQFLIKASEASGSQIHNVVLNVGHAFGVKFKPWQAVNIAKNIGNVAKILGPVVSVLALFVDIKDSVKEGSYYSVFVETDLNKASTIDGQRLSSEDAIAEYIASMLLLETDPVFYISYDGVYTTGGADYYEFRCHR